MFNRAHSQHFLDALDGVDQKIDEFTLSAKGHTADARQQMSEGQEHESTEPPAGTDPHTGEENMQHEHYRHGANYDGKGQPGGHDGHPFAARGAGEGGAMSRKPLFGKRFAR